VIVGAGVSTDCPRSPPWCVTGSRTALAIPSGAAPPGRLTKLLAVTVGIGSSSEGAPAPASPRNFTSVGAESAKPPPFGNAVIVRIGSSAGAVPFVLLAFWISTREGTMIAASAFDVIVW
jgi:hypothetical protein